MIHHLPSLSVSDSGIVRFSHDVLILHLINATLSGTSKLMPVFWSSTRITSLIHSILAMYRYVTLSMLKMLAAVSCMVIMIGLQRRGHPPGKPAMFINQSASMPDCAITTGPS